MDIFSGFVELSFPPLGIEEVLYYIGYMYNK